MKKFKNYLTNGKSLLSEDDSQELLHSSGVQVFLGTCSQLKSIVLKILKTVLNEDSICCVNCLNTIL